MVNYGMNQQWNQSFDPYYNYNPIPRPNSGNFQFSYGSNIGNQQRPPQMNNILQVMGIESAREFKIAPNSQVILVDSSKPVFYIKRSDDSGYSEIKTYKFQEISDENQEINDASDYVTSQEFEELKKTISKYATTAEVNKLKKMIEDWGNKLKKMIENWGNKDEQSDI